MDNIYLAFFLTIYFLPIFLFITGSFTTMNALETPRDTIIRANANLKQLIQSIEAYDRRDPINTLDKIERFVIVIHGTKESTDKNTFYFLKKDIRLDAIAKHTIYFLKKDIRLDAIKDKYKMLFEFYMMHAAMKIAISFKNILKKYFTVENEESELGYIKIKFDNNTTKSMSQLLQPGNCHAIYNYTLDYIKLTSNIDGIRRLVNIPVRREGKALFDFIAGVISFYMERVTVNYYEFAFYFNVYRHTTKGKEFGREYYESCKIKIDNYNLRHNKAASPLVMMAEENKQDTKKESSSSKKLVIEISDSDEGVNTQEQPTKKKQKVDNENIISSALGKLF